MKFFYVLLFALWLQKATHAQELYVYTDPASNVPARSLSIKLGERFVTRDNIYSRFSSRLMPQVTVGLSKKIMLRGGITISNMHTPNTRYESFNLYAKYRFYSSDQLHKHFRMAAWVLGSRTRVPFHYDEISQQGDKSGVELGFTATQLWHKFALSANLSTAQVFDKSRASKVLYIPPRYYGAVNASLSAGLLLLPKDYTDYRQTNLNLYTEIFWQSLPDAGKNYVDMAPALQVIINSNLKVNAGYRFQVAGNMQRMANSYWLLGIERTFLDIFPKKH